MKITQAATVPVRTEQDTQVPVSGQNVGQHRVAVEVGLLDEALGLGEGKGRTEVVAEAELPGVIRSEEVGAVGVDVVPPAAGW